MNFQIAVDKDRYYALWKCIHLQPHQCVRLVLGDPNYNQNRYHMIEYVADTQGTIEISEYGYSMPVLLDYQTIYLLSDQPLTESNLDATLLTEEKRFEWYVKERYTPVRLPFTETWDFCYRDGAACFDEVLHR